jgi:hypothetical protein
MSRVRRRQTRKKKKVVKTTCIYIKGVPLVLKNYYKAYCAKRDITMSEDIMSHMKEVTKTAREADEDLEYEPEE